MRIRLRLLDDHGVMWVSEDDLIECCEIAGAAAFLDFASEADVQLFV